MCTAAFGTLLCGNHHNAVGCLRTVESRSSSTLKDRDVVDVLGVDVYKTVRLDALVVPVAVVVGVAVADRHTVEHEQRLCVT